MTVISSTAIVDLIARLEKATGPSLELDMAIALMLHPKGSWSDWPRFTLSIDAALTLVPQQEFLVWSLWCAIGSYSCNIHISGGGWSDDRTLGTSAGAKTPAIALCIAALRARAAVEERK